VDHSLVSADLKNGQAVKAADVTDSLLTGTDVATDSLTGTDIKEGTLGQVRSATLGGLGRSAANEWGCNPPPISSSAAFTSPSTFPVRPGFS
jgi:hypothetical protein